MTTDSNRPSFGSALMHLAPSSTPRRFQVLKVRSRASVWEVTRDGHIYGNYTGHQAAFADAESAALAIVARGGSADIRFNEQQPHPGVGGPAPEPGRAPIGRLMTMEFRPGSAPVLR